MATSSYTVSELNPTTRVVYLKEYPKFWQRLRIVLSRLSSGSELTAQKVIKDEFGIDVDIRSAHQLGMVMMTEETYSWFLMQWS